MKNPLLLYKYILNVLESRKAKKLFIKTVFTNEKEFLAYANEVKKSGLIDELNQAKNQFEKSVSGKTYRGNLYSFGALGYRDGIRLYSLIRKTKPNVLVETGVCNGVSTAFILLALHKNKMGKLYSIDFPEVEGIDYKKGAFWEGKGGAVIPHNQEPGWAIPQYIKKRWKLILGKSQEKLPLLLKELKQIDFFIHDSEHSYECMMFEFNEAFTVLKKNGVLVSDDITWNNSFYDFCKQKNLKPMKISGNIGFTFK
ncbi:class I SAM-dependent methyltransferase [candidate division WOR-3 bacterium]|nr:class I SAM-dependent methyltransferase [candidate division WOR-3 bacterium]